MKPLTKTFVHRWSLPALLLLFILVSCQKEKEQVAGDAESLVTQGRNSDQGHLKQTKTFSAAGAMKWHDLQLRLLWYHGGNPAYTFATYGLHGSRFFAYQGIALYESVVPGMPSYRSLSGQLNQVPAMPSTEPGRAYHWAASANAALHYLTKNFYTRGFTQNLAAIDSLYQALKTEYQQQADAATFERSEKFGLDVAKLVFEWSKTDGASAPCTFTLPPDPTNTKWSNTAPNPTTMAFPCWGNNRYFVPGSNYNVVSPLPPPYSTQPGSAYRQMVEEVYNISQSLTTEQKATATYFLDNPGLGAGAHYQAIFNQVMNAENPQLDFYAEAQAKVGMALAETQIHCWWVKYTTFVDRPTRYIRDVLGHTTWTSYLPMPNHPDFPSGHSQTGGAFASVMSSIFGADYPITLHTYDHIGLAPRPYPSFDAMTDDIGISRVYGGIHYRYSCEEGKKQGWKIGENILNILQFKKE